MYQISKTLRIDIKALDEKNTSVFVYLNDLDNEIDEDELDELPLENGDVIIVKAEVVEKDEDGDKTITTCYYKVTLKVSHRPPLFLRNLTVWWKPKKIFLVSV